jgi:hypothetical protein
MGLTGAPDAEVQVNDGCEPSERQSMTQTYSAFRRDRD